jgi:glycosyltransferase involved in cell wall biosynthesis
MRLVPDVTRLRLRGGRTTPSGIDRVEYAYLTHALLHSDRLGAHFFSFQRFGAGLLSRSEGRALESAVANAWRLDRRPEDDVAFRALKRALESPLSEKARIASRIVVTPSIAERDWTWEQRWTGTRMALRTEKSARAKIDATAARIGKPIYLHTSHTRLEGNRLSTWLGRASVAPVFFLHDVIPIDTPEFCRPGEDLRHWRRLGTMARHGRLILTNSRATAAAAAARIAEAGWPEPRFAVVPLGVENCFRDARALAPPRAVHPYAVVVGTIEARKNLAYLFSIWSRLVERHGARTPRLVVIGRRGWENEDVLDYLERSRRLAPFLIEVSDLADAGLASVMAGAGLVLAPSKSEGFSLPVAEGLTLGRRVAASDIPAHREVGQGLARLIDPLDGLGWLRAVEEAFGLGDADQSAFPAPGRPYQPLNWREHVEQALGHAREHIEQASEHIGRAAAQ